MANPTTHGTAHVFGVAGTITTATVQSFSLDEDEQNKTNTLNESGNEIERRRDDKIQSGTITLRYQSGYAIAASGDVITYDSVNYEVDTVGNSETNNAHVVVTYSIKTTEYVTLTPPA
jgi:hypothetical protein